MPKICPEHFLIFFSWISLLLLFLLPLLVLPLLSFSSLSSSYIFLISCHFYYLLSLLSQVVPLCISFSFFLYDFHTILKRKEGRKDKKRREKRKQRREGKKVRGKNLFKTWFQVIPNNNLFLIRRSEPLNLAGPRRQAAEQHTLNIQSVLVPIAGGSSWVQVLESSHTDGAGHYSLP